MAKKIIAVVSTKGGVGKTSASIHILPILLGGNCAIIEIDEFNNSILNFEKEKDGSLDELIFAAKSTKLKELETTIAEVVFDFENGADDVMDENIIIDTGSGENTKKVIEQMKDYQVEEVIFVIPLTPTRKQIQNAIDTYTIAKEVSNKIIFAKIGNAPEDFFLFDGSKELKIPCRKPKDAKEVFIKSTALLDLAEIESKTLYKLASIARKFSRKEFQETAGGDREKWMNDILPKYLASVKAQKYVEENIETIDKNLFEF